MIIRSNLASFPIKNYSLFLLGCIALAIIIVAFTVWNVISLTGAYSTTAELKETIGRQQRQLQDFEAKAGDLQARISRIKTPQFVAETEFMNNAIKRRTFSWTALFDHFEQILPPTVKMTSIVPSVDDEEKIAISLEMSGQSLGDMLELVRLMERYPQFGQVVLKGERVAEDEQVQFSISLNYLPPQEAGPQASAKVSEQVASR